MSDERRVEGNGPAVAAVVIVAILVLLGGAGTWFYLRSVQMARVAEMQARMDAMRFRMEQERVEMLKVRAEFATIDAEAAALGLTERHAEEAGPELPLDIDAAQPAETSAKPEAK